jgi:prepilin-type N-terminal cleavage/methylation domain-containing protein
MIKCHQVSRSVRSLPEGQAEPPRRGQGHKCKGFTLIEILITILIWGILIIPIAMMTQEHIVGAATAADITAGYNLARLEMSKINNLSYADPTLADGYYNTAADYQGYKYDLNRAVSYVPDSSNNLKRVTVVIYGSGTPRQAASLVTYVANVAVGAGSGGAPAGSIQSNDLIVSDGEIYNQGSHHQLRNVTLKNANLSAAITITGVIAGFTGGRGISFKKITLQGNRGWSGNAFSGDQVDFNPSSRYFNLAPNATYSNSLLLEFNKNLGAVTSLVFILSDGSRTVEYSW